MPRFFKGIEEKPKPFQYNTTVEARKGSNNYLLWGIGISILLVLLGIVIFVLH